MSLLSYMSEPTQAQKREGLRDAFEDGSAASVRKAFVIAADVVHADKDMLLCQAAGLHNAAAVTELVKKGAAVNVWGDQKTRFDQPLYCAVTGSRVSWPEDKRGLKLKTLLRMSDPHDTQLIETVKILLDAGTRTDSSITQEALIEAAGNGQTEVVDLMLKAGVGGDHRIVQKAMDNAVQHHNAAVVVLLGDWEKQHPPRTHVMIGMSC